MLRDDRSRAVLRGESFEMKKFDVRWATLITFIVLLSGWWYWYEYRPTQIEEDCAEYTARVSAAVVGNQDVRMSGEVHLKIIEHMQQACENAGGAAAFEKALKDGQRQNEDK